MLKYVICFRLMYFHCDIYKHCDISIFAKPQHGWLDVMQDEKCFALYMYIYCLDFVCLYTLYLLNKIVKLFFCPACTLINGA